MICSDSRAVHNDARRSIVIMQCKVTLTMRLFRLVFQCAGQNTLKNELRNPLSVVHSCRDRCLLGHLNSPKSRQQFGNDADPLRIRRFPANRLARPTVPVRCVALVAFLSVEIGVHP